MFTVYVLYSPTYKKTYIGFTSDIEQRLISHNHPNNKGWTKRFQPWELAYSEVFNTKEEAMQREHQLKSSRGREFVHQQIVKYLELL